MISSSTENSVAITGCDKTALNKIFFLFKEFFLVYLQKLKKILLDSGKFNPYKINDIFDEDAAQNDTATGSGDAEPMASGLTSGNKVAVKLIKDKFTRQLRSYSSVNVNITKM